MVDERAHPLEGEISVSVLKVTNEMAEEMGKKAFTEGRELFTNPFTGSRAKRWKNGWRKEEATS